MKMMNNEEAMVELHECFNCLRFRSDLSVLNYKKALVLVIKALRKQIPMKPNNIKDILDFLEIIILQEEIVQCVGEKEFLSQIYIVINVDRNLIGSNILKRQFHLKNCCFYE